MKKKQLLIGITLICILGSVFYLLSLFLVSSLGLNGKLTKSSKVAIINIENVITQSNNTIQQIKKYTDDKSIKAIVLRIDSPGGGVAPSQEIYSEILKVRKNSNKKVVASMGNLAASGGYYIACASDKIVANPGTLTGSIGVIMTFSNIEELMKKIGMKTEVIKSGKFKDIGSPVRRFTEEEKKLIQGVIDDVYDQFVHAVSDSRSMDVHKVKELSDGRIFTGKQAFEIGLVDELGGLEDAVKLAAELVGIEGKPKIVSEKKERSLLFRLLEKKALSYLPSQLQIFPGLQYLWQY